MCRGCAGHPSFSLQPCGYSATTCFLRYSPSRVASPWSLDRRNVAFPMPPYSTMTPAALLCERRAATCLNHEQNKTRHSLNSYSVLCLGAGRPTDATNDFFTLPKKCRNIVRPCVPDVFHPLEKALLFVSAQVGSRAMCPSHWAHHRGGIVRVELARVGAAHTPRTTAVVKQCSICQNMRGH
jgi:hypothetical protein